MNEALQKLLGKLDPGQELEFASFLLAIYEVRFTGRYSVDCLNGIPRQINIGEPIKLTICAGGTNGGTTGGVDKRKPPRTG